MNNMECSRLFIDLAFVGAIRINGAIISQNLSKIGLHPIITKTRIFTLATAEFAKQYAETIGVN